MWWGHHYLESVNDFVKANNISHNSQKVDNRMMKKIGFSLEYEQKVGNFY